jgi:hypothetical protein
MKNPLPIPNPKRVVYDPNKPWKENGDCWITAGPFAPGGCFDITSPRDPFESVTIGQVREYLKKFDEAEQS